MKILSQITENFFWKPAGCVSSLESLELSRDMASKRDVTVTVGGTKEKYPLTVAEFPGGKIVGDLRMVATSNDIVVGEIQSLLGSPDLQNHYLLKRRRFRFQKYYRGTALLLGTANSDNYYHWLLDCVPRWKMLQAADWQNYDLVLLSARPSLFQDEVLDRLKVPEAKRFRCSKYFVHQFERLIVPAMPFPLDEAASWSCSYVRSLFPEKAPGPERIYLHRGAGRRRLINEAELETALKTTGFISAQPDKMSVAEQAKLLSAARCIVGPHGAALTNALFAPPGARLLELFHPQHKNRCYVNIAAACGHHYASLDGRSANQAGDRQLEYTIDVPAVLQMVAEKK